MLKKFKNLQKFYFFGLYVQLLVSASTNLKMEFLKILQLVTLQNLF